MGGGARNVGAVHVVPVNARQTGPAPRRWLSAWSVGALVLLAFLGVVWAAVLLGLAAVPRVYAEVVAGAVRVQNGGAALRGARVEVSIDGSMHRLTVDRIAPGTTDLPWAGFTPPIPAHRVSGGVEIHARRLGLPFSWYSAAPQPGGGTVGNAGTGSGGEP